MKWFLNQSNKVHGPYDNAEVQDLIQTLGSGAKQSYIWTRGMSEWMTADKWNPNYIQNINTQVERKFNTDATTINFVETKPAAVSRTIDSGVKPIQKYKVQYNFIDQNQMTKDELLEFTIKQSDISKISVFDPNTKSWREIYAIPEIAEKLGLSRRKTPRIPILAQFIGTSAKGLKLNSRVVTISVGGMGFTDTFELTIDDQIRGQITSPHFFTPLNIEAEVTYTGTDGYVGLKFTQINDDTAALITDYVNRFSEKH